MDLILSRCDDARNVIGKTLADSVTFSVTLRGDFDITAPSIMLEMPAGTDALSFDYAEIPELSRYYFIEQVESINAKIWRFSLSCDVLETYKADILTSKARYRRNLETGDYIGGSLAISDNFDVTRHESTGGFVEDQSIIVATLQGKDGSSSDV